MTETGLCFALQSRYSKNIALAELVYELSNKHIAQGLCDNNAIQRLCSINYFEYWQQLTEILLTEQLILCELNPIHQAVGPDILIENGGKKIWIETITPEPTGLPDEWINYVEGRAISVPHDKILLRWTAALKEKSEKFRKYKSEGLIGLDDICVIAINGRLLRGFNGAFPEFYGISQFPFAVEAALGVGPLQIRLDIATLQAVSSEILHRPNVQNHNRADVASNVFLDSSHEHIDALWAVDLDENVLLSKSCSMAVVHNPNCNNELPLKLLPAQIEYATSVSASDYIIQKITGRLHVEN
jgi:hypothetical protein